MAEELPVTHHTEIFHTRHCTYNLHVHLVFVVKYRKKNLHRWNTQGSQNHLWDHLSWAWRRSHWVWWRTGSRPLTDPLPSQTCYFWFGLPSQGCFLTADTAKELSLCYHWTLGTSSMVSLLFRGVLWRSSHLYHQTIHWKPEYPRLGALYPRAEARGFTALFW